MKERVYLDHNATMPLRPEARAAMVEAMEIAGNPSSVHAEGRAAKGLIEKVRGGIAEAFDIGDADVVFTSGATEAAALALAGFGHVAAAEVEHDCVRAWADQGLPVDAAGGIGKGVADAIAVQAANSETGVLQDVGKSAAALDGRVPRPVLVCDAVQIAGKMPWSFERSRADMALISAHKMGGPKGVGALIIRRGLDIPARIRGGGQEMGRRSGTENVVGIAGFGAAVTASIQDMESGTWDRVKKLRKILESSLDGGESSTIFVGQDVPRLPNTSCIMVPGWKGETQVMQMDLAGFAISAGSACSSGKVKSSAVLRAMGFSQAEAGSAIRVSLGPETTEDQVMAFAEAWTKAYDRFRARAA